MALFNIFFFTSLYLNGFLYNIFVDFCRKLFMLYPDKFDYYIFDHLFLKCFFFSPHLIIEIITDGTDEGLQYSQHASSKIVQ